MARVLVVEGDPELLCLYLQWLRQAGHSVHTAATGEQALNVLPDIYPDTVVLDMELPDMSGMDLLVRLGRSGIGCVLVTGHGDCRMAIKAIRLGAADFLEKPITEVDLCAAIECPRDSLERPLGALEVIEVEAHSLKRWAEPVVRMLQASEDPRTLKEWGRTVGVSTGALRNWCRTARIPARRTLLFARLLRVVVQQQNSQMPPECLLNVVDRRTLSKLLLLGGAHGDQLPATVADFLQRQQLIEDARAIAAIRDSIKGLVAGQASFLAARTNSAVRLSVRS